MPDRDVKATRLESEVRGMKLKEEDADTDMNGDDSPPMVKEESSAPGSGVATPTALKRSSRSPIKMQSTVNSPAVKSDDQETIGGDVTLKLEPGKPPKLSRSVSHKVEKRPPQLFLEYEDKTAEATSTFDILPVCTYANKYLGTTEHALECDCSEEWGKQYPYFHHISTTVAHATLQIKSLSPIMPVEKTPTASTAPPKWSALVTAIVA